MRARGGGVRIGRRCVTIRKMIGSGAGILIASDTWSAGGRVVMREQQQEDEQDNRTSFVLSRCGGSLCVEYRIGRSIQRGIVDSASPFLLFATEAIARGRVLPESTEWTQSPYRDTYEIFGLQSEGITDWVFADVAIGTDMDGKGAGQQHKSAGRSNTDVGLSYFPRTLVGVCAEVSTRLGADEAHGIGLVKDISDGIRPSLLSQTEVAAFMIEFSGDNDATLTLSRTPLIRDVVDDDDGRSRSMPIFDLRPIGSPVRHYAARIQRLIVNGAEVENVRERPTYGIIDTGTTGLLISRGLYDESAFATEGLLSLVVELENGTVLSATRSTCRGDCILLPLPIDIPWQGVYSPSSSSMARKQAHIMFLGLSLLPKNGTFVVDIDDGHMAIVDRSRKGSR